MVTTVGVRWRAPGRVAAVALLVLACALSVALGVPGERPVRYTWLHKQDTVSHSIHERQAEMHRALPPVRAHHEQVVARQKNVAPVPLDIGKYAKKKEALGDREVLGYWPHWNTAAQLKSIQWDLVTILGYHSLHAFKNGTLEEAAVGWPPRDLINLAHTAGTKVMVSVANFHTDELSELLGNEVVREQLIINVVTAVESSGVDGVGLDFENLPADAADELVDFLQALATPLRAAVPNALLSITLPPYADGSFHLGAMQDVVDYYFLMQYDFHWAGSHTAGAVAPLGGNAGYNVASSVERWMGMVPDAPHKFIMGIGLYGYDWVVESSAIHAATIGVAKDLTYMQCRGGAETFGSQWDGATSSPWYRYTHPATGLHHQVWYEDAKSILRKLEFVRSKDISMGIWALGYDAGTTEVWCAIRTAFTDGRCGAEGAALEGPDAALEEAAEEDASPPAALDE